MAAFYPHPFVQTTLCSASLVRSLTLSLFLFIFLFLTQAIVFSHPCQLSIHFTRHFRLIWFFSPCFLLYFFSSSLVHFYLCILAIAVAFYGTHNAHAMCPVWFTFFFTQLLCWMRCYSLFALLFSAECAMQGVDKRKRKRAKSKVRLLAQLWIWVHMWRVQLPQVVTFVRAVVVLPLFPKEGKRRGEKKKRGRNSRQFFKNSLQVMTIFLGSLQTLSAPASLACCYPSLLSPLFSSR